MSPALPALRMLAATTLAVALGACVAGQQPVGAAGDTYRALGEEPAWLLSIGAKSTRLEWDYGAHTLTVATPPAVNSANGKEYRARRQDRHLRIIIRHGLCHDTMSGMPYPDQVRVKLGQRELVGCGGDPASLLTGTEWVAEDISGRGMIDFARLTLHFDADGTVGGLAGCNRWQARWQLSGEGLSILQSAAVTRKSCAPALLNQEQRFLAVLAAVHRFDLDTQGKLVLHAGPEQHIIATPGQVRPAAP